MFLFPSRFGRALRRAAIPVVPVLVMGVFPGSPVSAQGIGLAAAERDEIRKTAELLERLELLRDAGVVLDFRTAATAAEGLRISGIPAWAEADVAAEADLEARVRSLSSSLEEVRARFGEEKANADALRARLGNVGGEILGTTTRLANLLAEGGMMAFEGDPTTPSVRSLSEWVFPPQRADTIMAPVVLEDRYRTILEYGNLALGESRALKRDTSRLTQRIVEQPDSFFSVLDSLSGSLTRRLDTLQALLPLWRESHLVVATLEDSIDATSVELEASQARHEFLLESLQTGVYLSPEVGCLAGSVALPTEVLVGCVNRAWPVINVLLETAEGKSKTEGSCPTCCCCCEKKKEDTERKKAQKPATVFSVGAMMYGQEGRSLTGLAPFLSTNLPNSLVTNLVGSWIGKTKLISYFGDRISVDMIFNTIDDATGRVEGGLTVSLADGKVNGHKWATSVFVRGVPDEALSPAFLDRSRLLHPSEEGHTTGGIRFTLSATAPEKPSAFPGEDTRKILERITKEARGKCRNRETAEGLSRWLRLEMGASETETLEWLKRWNRICPGLPRPIDSLDVAALAGTLTRSSTQPGAPDYKDFILTDRRAPSDLATAKSQAQKVVDWLKAEGYSKDDAIGQVLKWDQWRICAITLCDSDLEVLAKNVRRPEGFRSRAFVTLEWSGYFMSPGSPLSTLKDLFGGLGGGDFRASGSHRISLGIGFYFSR